MKRLAKDSYFLQIAEAASKRATCSRKSVGCVIVSDDDRIVATGYNGPPSGMPHEPHKHSKEECTSIHAEINALQYCNNTIDTTVYLTLSPCMICARELLDSGVRKVVFSDAHSSAPFSIAFLEQNDVEVKYQPHIIYEEV